MERYRIVTQALPDRPIAMYHDFVDTRSHDIVDTMYRHIVDTF